VDGWALSFRHVLLTVDRLRLNEDPDRDPGDATALGAEVASVDGPFAVDLSVGGNITGKSGSPDEKTVAIAALGSRKDGRPFDPAARYAFSYDLATATASAQRVNLDAEGAALYEQAIAKGWAMVFDGVATYKGPAPAAGSAFAELPQEVRFTLGFKNPASYINCENTDLQAVGEGFPRGLQANANKSTVAQITLHTDHLFWNKLQVEGTPLHFDALAAQAEVDPSTPTKGRLTIEALENVDITNVRTRGGAALPWRSLVSDHTAPAGTVRYDSAGIAFAKTNSLASFLSYSASGGGHLNADGECAIRRNYTP
jgi:hypothetical protein